MQKTILLTICLLSILSFPVSASEGTEAGIPVSCTADGYDGTFRYSLSAKSQEHQKILSGSIQMKDGESGMFTVEYDYPGTYRYQVVQDKGADPCVTYDAASYDVDVYVTEDTDGTMHAETIAYKNGSPEKTDGCRFVNVYTPPKGEDPGQVAGANAKTGDDTPAGIFALLTGSSASLIWLLARRKRRDDA